MHGYKARTPWRNLIEPVFKERKGLGYPWADLKTYTVGIKVNRGEHHSSVSGMSSSWRRGREFESYTDSAVSCS